MIVHPTAVSHGQALHKSRHFFSFQRTQSELYHGGNHFTFTIVETRPISDTDLVPLSFGGVGLELSLKKKKSISCAAFFWYQLMPKSS